MNKLQTDFCELLNGLRLIFYETWSVNFNCKGRNTYTFNRLFFVLSAEGKESKLVSVNEGKTFIMRPDHFYFVPSGLKFAFEFHEGTRFLSFHFNLNLFECLDIFFKSSKMLELPASEEDAEKLSAILENNGKISPSHIAMFNSIFYRLLLPFIPDESALADLKNRKKYADLLIYINSADAKTTISDLAKAAKMSRDTLSRSFPKDFGITLKRFLEVRLTARAEQLLRNPNLKIQHIADMLNFNDIYYFSKFFKKMTGSTPSDYRKEH